jgi:uncharacterized membrane protein YfcA
MAMHRAVASSLLVILLISTSTTLASWISMRMDVTLTAEFVTGSVLGLVIGALVVKRLAGATLQRTFAALVSAMGLALLVQSVVRT